MPKEDTDDNNKDGFHWSECKELRERFYRMVLPTVAIVLPVIERTEPVNVRTGGKSTRAMMKMIDQVFMRLNVKNEWKTIGREC